MFKTKDVHFAGDYPFKEKAITASVQTSDVFKLGGTLGGIRIRGYADGTITCKASDTVVATLEVAETADASAWTALESKTVTATGTSLIGDLFSFVTDTTAKYCRVTVKGAADMTGTFSVAMELIPH